MRIIFYTFQQVSLCNKVKCHNTRKVQRLNKQMLLSEPISLTMCCYTKEETGFGGRVIVLVYYKPLPCLEKCHPLWPRPWRRSPCNNMRCNVKLRGFRWWVSLTLMYPIPWIFTHVGRQVGICCFQWRFVQLETRYLQTVQFIHRYDINGFRFRKPFAPMSVINTGDMLHKARIHAHLRY